MLESTALSFIPMVVVSDAPVGRALPDDRATAPLVGASKPFSIESPLTSRIPQGRLHLKTSRAMNFNTYFRLTSYATIAAAALALFVAGGIGVWLLAAFA